MHCLVRVSDVLELMVSAHAGQEQPGEAMKPGCVTIEMIVYIKTSP